MRKERLKEGVEGIHQVEGIKSIQKYQCKGLPQVPSGEHHCKSPLIY